jgi:hypothetical protein
MGLFPDHFSIAFPKGLMDRFDLSPDIFQKTLKV